MPPRSLRPLTPLDRRPNRCQPSRRRRLAARQVPSRPATATGSTTAASPISDLAGKGRRVPGSPGHLPVGGFAPMVPELDVLDLEASLGFWCGILGFTVAYDRPERGFAYLERPVAAPGRTPPARDGLGQPKPVASACG